MKLLTDSGKPLWLLTHTASKENLTLRISPINKSSITLAVLAGILAGCSVPEEAPEKEVVVEAPSPEKWEVLQELYLSEIEESAPSNFANESAALSYLKQYCEIDQYGDAGEADVVDRIASKYCKTELSEKLGVREPTVSLVSVDEEEFTRVAGERFGVYEEVFEDGSSNTPVSLAKYICEFGDVSELERNLGDSFESSFQWFALETFCPQKLG